MKMVDFVTHSILFGFFLSMAGGVWHLNFVLLPFKAVPCRIGNVKENGVETGGPMAREWTESQ